MYSIDNDLYYYKKYYSNKCSSSELSIKNLFIQKQTIFDIDNKKCFLNNKSAY